MFVNMGKLWQTPSTILKESHIS